MNLLRWGREYQMGYLLSNHSPCSKWTENRKKEQVNEGKQKDKNQNSGLIPGLPLNQIYPSSPRQEYYQHLPWSPKDQPGNLCTSEKIKSIL